MQFKNWEKVSKGAGNFYSKKIQYYGNGDCSWQIIKKRNYKIRNKDSLIDVINNFWGNWV
jgi:hypothetical protein